MEGDVEAFVDARKVALVLPHVKAFAGNAFEKSGEGGNHIELRFPGAGGQAVGDQAGCLFFDAHFKLLILGKKAPGFAEFGGSVQVATDHEDLLGKGFGYQSVPCL